MEDSNQEVGEVGSALIHLQPADDAMVRQILGDASFGDAQMLGKFRFD